MNKSFYKEKQKRENNDIIGSSALFTSIRNSHQLHPDFVFFVSLVEIFVHP